MKRQVYKSISSVSNCFTVSYTDIALHDLYPQMASCPLVIIYINYDSFKFIGFIKLFVSYNRLSLWKLRPHIIINLSLSFVLTRNQLIHVIVLVAAHKKDPSVKCEQVHHINCNYTLFFPCFFRIEFSSYQYIGIYSQGHF